MLTIIICFPTNLKRSRDDVYHHHHHHQWHCVRLVGLLNTRPVSSTWVESWTSIQSSVACTGQVNLANVIPLQVKPHSRCPPTLMLASVTETGAVDTVGRNIPLWPLTSDWGALHPAMPCHHRPVCIHTYGRASNPLFWMVVDLTRWFIRPLTDSVFFYLTGHSPSPEKPGHRWLDDAISTGLHDKSRVT